MDISDNSVENRPAETAGEGAELKTVLETVDYWAHCWPQFFSSPETAIDEIAKKVRATLKGAAS